MTNNSKTHFFRISSATRACLREASQTPGYSLLNTLQGYIYGRWPYFYIGVGVGENRLIRIIRPLMNFLFNALNGFPADNVRIETNGPRPGNVQNRFFCRKERFAEIYHGKVIHLESAKKIVTVKRDICLTGLEKIIPYEFARDLILKKPEHIIALQCPCRIVRSNPCLPLDVCLIIGEPFASFAAEHHVDKCRWISSDEACAILEAEARRGHVHHAFFKEATLGRFFAICNCCDCCCGAMQAYRNDIPMLISSGYICVVDKDKCVTCGSCVDKCPFGAIRLADGHVQIANQACMGCGVCSNFCFQKALLLKRDHSRSDPLDLDLLLGEFCQS